MQLKPNPLNIKLDIEHCGIWYAIWRYGFRNLWPIFVATRIK